MGCCGGKRYIGNFIFKPIDCQTLAKCSHDSLDKMFFEIEGFIKRSEEVRSSIAAKFKDMIVATGSCVLLHPTVERSLSSFLILIMIEINKELGDDLKKLEEFDYKSLIQIDSKPPFVHINEEKKKELKNSFKVDIESNKDIQNCKQTILAFIETLNKFKDFFVELTEKTKKFYGDSLKIVEELKKQYKSDGKDHITAGQAFDLMATAEKNLEKVFDVSSILSLMGNLFLELASTIYTLSQKIMHPNELRKWAKIAADAAKKKIFDPKEIVFVYALEEKCKRIQDWEQNICYREEEEELKF